MLNTRRLLPPAVADAIFYTCIGCAIVYGVKFGQEQQKLLVLSWVVALVQTYLILEPLQIIFAAAAPCCFDEEHAFGRCMTRCRLIFNEIFAP